MSSCLVTEEIKFDNSEENVPPVILDYTSSNTKIGDIIYFDVESPSTIRFEFSVRDENIGQLLKGRSKIHQQSGNGYITQKHTTPFDIAPEYELDRYAYFDIGENSFEKDNCYKIDLAVSFKFKYDSESLYQWDIPEEKDDIARASWYVVTGEEIECGWATEYKQ